MLALVGRAGCRGVQSSVKRFTPVLTQSAGLAGSTVTHWKAERYVSVLTVGAMAGAVLHPCLAVDHSLAILIPLHAHWGLEQVFLDYVHGNVLPRIIHTLLKLLSGFTVVALLYFNQHDIGITQAVKDVWNIKKPNPEELGLE